jgi:hypothetical protein
MLSELALGVGPGLRKTQVQATNVRVIRNMAKQANESQGEMGKQDGKMSSSWGRLQCVTGSHSYQCSHWDTQGLNFVLQNKCAISVTCRVQWYRSDTAAVQRGSNVAFCNPPAEGWGSVFKQAVCMTAAPSNRISRTFLQRGLTLISSLAEGRVKTGCGSRGSI